MVKKIVFIKNKNYMKNIRYSFSVNNMYTVYLGGLSTFGRGSEG